MTATLPVVDMDVVPFSSLSKAGCCGGEGQARPPLA